MEDICLENEAQQLSMVLKRVITRHIQTLEASKKIKKCFMQK